MKKINLSTEYETRNGKPAIIYNLNGGGPYPVHGAFMIEPGVWQPHQWTEMGTAAGPMGYSLQGVLDKFKRERWVNIYKHEETLHRDKYSANAAAANADYPRIACLQVILEGEEGYGLEDEEVK